MENRIVGSLVMNTCGDPWVNVLRLNLALDALAPKGALTEKKP
jgi:K+-transporting ATPase c subunit